jgi:PAS domain S-box-containing protein
MADRDRGDGEAGERVFLSSREAAENGAESPAGDLEARLRVLLDLLPEVLVEVDMTSRIVFVNRTGLELFGYDLADPWQEMTVFDVLAPECHETAARNIAGILQEKEPRWTEYTAKRKDGSLFPVMIRSNLVKRDGEPIGFRSVVVDITERKKMENELVEANARLSDALRQLRNAQQLVIQQERLSALGQMAAGIAHDLNNALMPVLANCEMLIRKPEALTDRNRTDTLLNEIRTAACDAAETVRRLRDFAGEPKSLGREQVDLAELVDTTVALTRPRWKDEMEAKGVFLTVYKQTEGNPVAYASTAQLREVLANLIFNAVDAVPEGGSITVRARSNASKAVLEVSDTGSGMTREVRRRCMEPFFTTKGTTGTGLGLSMVYGTVRSFGGSVYIRSGTGKGTTIAISIPHAGGRSTAATRAPVSPAPAFSARILVVDDEESCRVVLSRILQEENHLVTMATNGEEALEAFRREPFDVVITDRAMPGVKGDEVAAAVKREAPSTPVILLTGFGAVMNDGQEAPENIDILLGKPVTVDELLQAVAKLTSKRPGRS